MVRGLRPRDCIRGVVDARRAHRGCRGCNRSCQPSASNPPRQSSYGRGVEDAAPTVGAKHALRNVMKRVLFPHVSQMVRGLCPRNINRWSANTRLTHRGWHGCNRSSRTAASNAARRPHQRGASRTPPLTGSSDTKLAAYNAAGAVNYAQTTRPFHGSAETYPHAHPVGGGVPDAPCVG